jgi:hypothetical protein
MHAINRSQMRSTGFIVPFLQLIEAHIVSQSISWWRNRRQRLLCRLEEDPARARNHPETSDSIIYAAEHADLRYLSPSLPSIFQLPRGDKIHALQNFSTYAFFSCLHMSINAIYRGRGLGPSLFEIRERYAYVYVQRNRVISEPGFS